MENWKPGWTKMIDRFYGPMQKALSIRIESALLQFGPVQKGRSIYSLVHGFHSDRTSLPKIFLFQQNVKVQWNTFDWWKRWSFHYSKSREWDVRYAWISKSSSVQSPKIFINFQNSFFHRFHPYCQPWFLANPGILTLFFGRNVFQNMPMSL